MGGTGQDCRCTTPARFGQDAGQIARQAAAGDVADAAQGEIPQQVEHRLHVDAGGFDQFLPQGAAQLRHLIGDLEAVLFQEHPAHQGIAVVVQAVGGDADDRWPTAISEPSMIWSRSTTPTTKPARS